MREGGVCVGGGAWGWDGRVGGEVKEGQWTACAVRVRACVCAQRARVVLRLQQAPQRALRRHHLLHALRPQAVAAGF